MKKLTKEFAKHNAPVLGASGLVALLLLLGSGGCSGKKGGGGAPIQIDGSSTVAPVSMAVAERFMDDNPGAQVDVATSGTTGGFQKFLRGELDVCDASRPIKESELTEAREKGIEYVELPICFDALTVAIHPDNDWAEQMTVSQLKKLWEPGPGKDRKGEVHRWKHLDPKWPDEPVRLLGAGQASGTFEYFTEAIVGKAGQCRTDYNGTENDNIIVNGIAKDRYALGFLPFAYFAQQKGKLKAVKVKWDKQAGADFVEPTLENVRDGKYAPLSRPLFIYVKRSSLDRPEVQQFVDYYVKHAAEVCEQVKYLPLPSDAYEVVAGRAKNKVTGTAFEGKNAIGLPVKDILERKPKS